jgi:acyl-coenzyme A synthetase/AMP-(fatty) acid ligase
MLTHRIHAHALQRPDTTAIVFNDRQVSYREFAALIGICRRQLVAEGLTGANGVAVVAIPSLKGWIAGLALRGLGLTTLSAPSLAAAGSLGLRDIRCVVAVAGECWPGLDRLCADRGWRLIILPDPSVSSTWQDVTLEAPDWPVEPGGRILLTSGTTGAFKKSLFDPIGHAAAPHRLYVFGFSDRSLVNAMHLGAWTAIGYNVPANTWALGGAVLLSDGSQPYASFQHPGITHAFAMPQFLGELLQRPPNEIRYNEKLQLIVTAGALSRSQFEAARARLTNHIYTSVGSTEAGVFTLTRIEQPDDLQWHRVVPECEVQIVDDAGQVLPSGQRGHIRVRVADGAIGYLGDEAATREFFHDGYFYPGDLGVFRSDGRLALHGRTTDVLNVQGNKVAPAPIEERLVDVCGVAAACLLSSRSGEGEEIVHVVLQSTARVPESELTAVLTKLVPVSFRAQVHYVEALPRNHMGKIQRDVLRQRLGLV